MANVLNPYAAWLKLPEEVVSPDYFMLLGISEEEVDAEVIRSAASGTLAKIRAVRPGEHIGAWTSLLEEIRKAEETLTNPIKRKAYQSQLKSSASGKLPSSLPPKASPNPAAASSNLQDSFEAALAEELGWQVSEPSDRSENATTSIPNDPPHIPGARPGDAAVRHLSRSAADAFPPNHPSSNEGVSPSINGAIEPSESPSLQESASKTQIPMLSSAEAKDWLPISIRPMHQVPPLPPATLTTVKKVGEDSESFRLPPSAPSTNDAVIESTKSETTIPLVEPEAEPPSEAISNVFSEANLSEPDSMRDSFAAPSARSIPSKSSSGAATAGAFLIFLLAGGGLAAYYFIFQDKSTAENTPPSRSESTNKQRQTFETLPPIVEEEMKTSNPPSFQKPEIEVVEPTPSTIPTLPKPDPDPVTPSEPTEKQVQQFQSAIKDGLMALRQGNQDVAKKHLKIAEENAFSDQDQTILSGLAMLGPSAAQFEMGLKAGMGKLKATSTFELNERSYIVVESSPERLVLRSAGQRYRFAAEDFPPSLALHVAKFGVDADSESFPLCAGAYFLLHQKEGKRLADAQWAIAKDRGADVAGLTALLPFVEE